MISLGGICRNIMFRDDAAAVLAVHAGFLWNKAGTRIRCTAEACAEVIDVPDGPGTGSAAIAYARHQAEQLPEPFDIDVPGEPAADEVAAPAEPEPEAALPEPAADPEPEPIPESDPEPIDPAGDPVETTDSAPAPKIRRDTKALTATIAEIGKGDRVLADFNHPRYGVFTIEGTVLKGGAGLDRNQLSVGGWYLNLNDRAAKHLHGLEILAAAGRHNQPIPKPSEASEHIGIGA